MNVNEDALTLDLVFRQALHATEARWRLTSASLLRSMLSPEHGLHLGPGVCV